LKLNLKNIVVTLKYLNEVKFQSSWLDRIRPNFGWHKLSLIWPNKSRERLGQNRPRSIWQNLVKFRSDSTRSNLAKFRSSQLCRIRPILARDDLVEFDQVDSTKFWLGWLGQISFTRPILAKFQPNSGQGQLDQIWPNFGHVQLDRIQSSWLRSNSVELA